jgi:hypothetical protein
MENYRVASKAGTHDAMQHKKKARNEDQVQTASMSILRSLPLLVEGGLK